MNDPHVNTLRYKLETNKYVSYEQCAPIKQSKNEYILTLNDGILTFDFTIHFADVASARAYVDRILKTWEIDVALQYGKGEFQFIYLDANVIDRNPPPPGSVIQCAASIQCSVTINPVIAHVTRSKYPDWPTMFIATPDVESLWHRLGMYLDGRDQLLSMAYFCLSYLEGVMGNRSNVGKKYCIDRIVLDKLGDLTSARGDKGNCQKGKRS